MSQVAELVLASGSPRRRELLAALGLRFKVAPADIDEAPELEEAPQALVERLSLLKAAAARAEHPQALVIAADTVVVLAGEILNKPRDEGENCDFLEKLSGRVHLVHTGHASLFGGRAKVSVVTTAVRFRRLGAREIDWYVATGEGLDKAGGYGIQGRGAALVSRVEGCYFNVVGLSVAQIIEDARALGVELV
jgi:septum formation protein